MLHQYDFEKAIDIGNNYINNEEKQNLILIVCEDIKENLLNHFNLKDIEENNEEELFNEKLIICTFDKYNTLNENLLKQNKLIVI